MSFETLGLSAELLRAVAAQGYTEPTPIQQKAIPSVLEGRDVLAGAQTGTGKTAAFTLPILQLLDTTPRTGGNPRAPRVLVMTPTRELAAQIAESVRTYGRHHKVTTTVIFGGVGFNPQKDELKRGTDVLVATPGRLLDHANQRTVDLSGIEILVLDEADRMLDMGFIHDIRKVIALLPAERQNLMFSATYTDEIRTLAGKILRNPAEVEVARRNTAAERVTQHAYFVEKSDKRDLLIHLIEDGKWFQALVFTRTKHGANRLAEQLNRAGVEAAAIHGNKSQSARTSALAGFKTGKVRILVATDIAARGLDIDGLPHVVNYELPNVPEDYVHRIGRTGRAGESGVAVSLVDHEERRYLKSIERLLGREVSKLPVPEFVRRAPAVDTRPARPERGNGRRPVRSSSNSNSNRARSNGSPGNSARGNTAHGNSAHGNSAHGNSAHGNTANGNTVDGNTVNGNSANGNQTHHRGPSGNTDTAAAATRKRRPRRRSSQASGNVR